MSDTKFTKGDWSTDGMGIVESEKGIVCDTYMTCEEGLANANLIKTSPSMYKMLESLREYCGIDSKAGKDIDALLAEARGEL